MVTKLFVCMVQGIISLFLVSLALPAAAAEAQSPPASLSNVPAVPEQGTAPSTAPTATQFYPGTGTMVGTPRARLAPSAPSGEDEITLNFANADVRDVARAVLGDFLKLNYAVGASVQSNITLQTSRPVPASQVLQTFEQALRLNGLALIHTNDIYKVVPMAEAANAAGVAPSTARGRPEAGYGTQVVRLKYASATDMARVLEGFSGAQGSIHADAARNVIVVQGTAQERATLLDTIALFDVNWLTGMSFALYSPQYIDARELARELNEIMGGHGSPISGVVRLVPIDRLNALLAISPQARYLDQLQRWVERLDRPGEGSDRRLFVYHVQNGRATDLAGVLTKVFFGMAPAPRPAVAPDINDPSPAAAAGAAPEPASIISGGVVAGGSFANVSITADETNNALVIMATAPQFGAIEQALRELDAVPMQVLLEAAIAEVTLTNDLRYGVQYFYQPGSSHQIVLSAGPSAAIGPTFPGFSYMFSQGDNIRIVLDALSSVTNVKVMSMPEVMVLNNQTATLQVGDQVPVVTQQAVNTITTDAPVVNSVQYHDTGVILRVTPRVNRGGMVMMDISQEVSAVVATTTSGIDSPTIKQRKITSSVAIRDGETVALGGLILNDDENGHSGIPLLGDIPIIGNLFRSTSHTFTKTELIVLITPHVIDNTERARTVTEELRRKLPSLRPLLEGLH
jgi:general secretion pathway protein D